MQLERYQPGEAAALAELFYQTVHAVCTGDYTPAQLDAWTDGKVDIAAWERSFLRHDTLVARIEGGIVGLPIWTVDIWIGCMSTKSISGRG